MSVIDDYIATLDGADKVTIARLYDIVRQMVPDATEETYYGMPAFKYKGKGLVAVMANKDFLSLYPFGAIDKLGLDFSAYECTSGSIHFSSSKPLPDEMFRKIINARLRQIK